METPTRTAPDWEAIEGEYRAGVFSIREISRRHNVSHVAIQKRAKRLGWARDLTKSVQETVRAALVTETVTKVTSSYAPAREGADKERVIVEEAAKPVIELIRVHRRRIDSAQAMVGMLLEQLHHAAVNRDEIVDIIDDATEPGPKRAAMQRAVSLPARAVTLKDLALAMKNLIALERQAFNIEATPEEPPDPSDVSPIELSMDAYAAKLDEVIRANGRTPTEPTAAGGDASADTESLH